MRRQNHLATLSRLIAVSVALLGCDNVNRPPDLATSVVDPAERRNQECLASVPSLIERADTLVTQGRADEAIAALNECSGPLLGRSSDFVLALDRAKAAKVKQQLDTTPKHDWWGRLRLLEEWSGLVRELPAPFDKELATLRAKQDAERARERRFTEQAKAMKYYPFCSEVGRLLRSKGPLNEKGEAFMAYARSAYGIRAEDEGLIRVRELAIGMPMCAVVASLGVPSEVREIATRSSKSWSVWYRDRQVLIYLDADQRVTRYSR